MEPSLYLIQAPDATPFLPTALQAFNLRGMISRLAAPRLNLTYAGKIHLNSWSTWGPFEMISQVHPSQSPTTREREELSYLHGLLVKDETAYPKPPENMWHQTQALEFGLNQSRVQLSVLKTKT